MILRALASVSLLLGASALAPLPAVAADPVFTDTACPTDWPTGVREVRCGNLTVDEVRDGSSPRRIDIAVVIVKAATPYRDAQGDLLPPLVDFHGGPGGYQTSNLARFLLAEQQVPGMLPADQDMIFFDQRGAGRGSPSMDCPGVELTDAGPPSDEDRDGLIACMKSYQAQGVDLNQYNARVIADDVRDLAQVLGLTKIDLSGGSYGPRIQAAVITHQPQLVRAVVMDSPWPPEGNWVVGAPQQLSETVRIVLAKCAAQAECAARHPDIHARFETEARRWLAGPVTGRDGRTFTVDDLSTFLMETTFSRAGVRSLPRDLEAIIAGDLSAVAATAENRTYYFEGQHMAHLCKEELPFETRAGPAAGAMGDALAQTLVVTQARLFDICDAIGLTPADPIENAPVTTDIPTLFVAAEIDPGCPPHLTEAAARGYSNGQVVIVTNATHGVIRGSRCTRDMMRDFLRNPYAPVDRSCLPAADTPLDFTLDPPMP